MYTCKNCTKCFDKKYQWLNHTNKKNECHPLLPQNGKKLSSPIKVIDKKPFKCGICNKGFTTRGNLKRHNLTVGFCCENFVFKCKGQTNFIKPGTETTTQFTREALLELLNTKSFASMHSDMAKVLYFNKDAPENCNWIIAYSKNDKGAIIYNYDLNQFERKPTIDVMNDKFSNMMDLLLPLIEELYKEDEKDDFLNRDQKKNIAKFYGLYGVHNIFEEAVEIYYSIHEMAFNNKVIPMEYWKEHGLNANHLSIKLNEYTLI